MDMKKINEILAEYTAGESTEAEANAALKEAGSDLYIDEAKNAIQPGEEGRFGLLDTGTGTLDKVEVADGRILNCDCGDMRVLCFFNGDVYNVRGTKLERLD